MPWCGKRCMPVAALGSSLAAGACDKESVPMEAKAATNQRPRCYNVKGLGKGDGIGREGCPDYCMEPCIDPPDDSSTASALELKAARPCRRLRAPVKRTLWPPRPSIDARGANASAMASSCDETAAEVPADGPLSANSACDSQLVGLWRRGNGQRR